ncbi:hypothetical protein NUW54_g639 [Trametes sanguinea]|uniref:Uncharacterized protein n=1 Tax=Trametes sanguinea TaxID=158606 RepID=A0ACC1QB26_9APHY|nr:hypothetical protein NUW54_g639 [Trametes sanguinea]
MGLKRTLPRHQYTLACSGRNCRGVEHCSSTCIVVGLTLADAGSIKRWVQIGDREEAPAAALIILATASWSASGLPMNMQKQLPDYVYLTPEAAQRQSERTRQGVYNLLPDEVEWQSRQQFLEKHGYMLRPRYHKGWKPSWIDTNIARDFCEDGIMSSRPQVLDAKRLEDNSVVSIKIVSKRNQELQVAQFLSSFKDVDQNHCVAVLDVLSDPLDSERALMVMPYLRPFDDPELVTVGEVIDFIGQMLQVCHGSSVTSRKIDSHFVKGLAFMHEHRVAHRDIAPPNVMMDAKPLYPSGHHPVKMDYTPDAVYDAIPLSRTEHPVRYYYVDFGLSVRFPENSPTMVVGDVGRDDEVPELSSTVPYDAFKADIYALGNLFDKEFVQRYHRLEILQPLIDSMKQRQPEMRLPAAELVVLFQKINKTVTKNALRLRLSLKSEAPYERVLNDAVAVAWNGINNLKRYVG